MLRCRMENKREVKRQRMRMKTLKASLMPQRTQRTQTLICRAGLGEIGDIFRMHLDLVFEAPAIT